MDSFKPYNIGSGSSSVVFRISSDRVIKCARLDQCQEIEHEHRVLERLDRHPLIVKSFGLQREGVLSLEYHPQTLRQFVRSGSVIPLMEWAVKITTSVVYIHSKRVIHFDLSTRNILVKASGGLALCDFAGSSLDGEGPAGLGTEGELRFSSPNRGRDATIQDDIFAMGSVFYELSTKAVPYTDRADEEVISLYCGQKFPPTNHLALGVVIAKCWKGSYSNAEQVLSDLV